MGFEYLKEYLLQNWGLILVLIAFAIMLHVTIFLDKKAVRRLYILIVGVFLLSIVVYIEFLLADIGKYRYIRIVLMAVRYSATPLIISQIIFTLVKKQQWYLFIPAIVLAALNAVSVFTGIVFTVDKENNFSRGPLGFLPFVFVGFYSVFLIYMLIKRSNKRYMEMIPIIFLGGALGSGLVMPFIFGSNYSQIFCTTIAIALFAYYVFSVLQLTKMDALTGLLNRQAYYADVSRNAIDITAIVSIDMNGLKTINDTQGHVAGDDAIVTISICFINSLRRRQSCYRVGGDEFIIVCRKNSESDVADLVDRIHRYVGETKYSCSVGYSFAQGGSTTIDDLLKKSDEMMYAEKERHYAESGISKRR